MKILLVDDDEAITTVFATALKQDGYDILIANDGQSGLEMAKSQHPNLILLDQLLPDMNGNEILRALKQDPQTTSIPVTLLSNFGQKELIDEALQSGASDYILKYKIKPDDLRNKIKQIIH